MGNLGAVGKGNPRFSDWILNTLRVKVLFHK